MRDVDVEIFNENLAARAEYLARVPCYGFDEIRDVMLADAGELDRWEESQRVFSIPSGADRVFPKFQFDDEQPIPVIQKVLRFLPEDMSNWQIAFWFDGGNAWLDGHAPQDCLGEQKALLKAAKEQSKDFIG